MKKFVSLLLALMMALGMTALAEESKDQLARIQEKGEIVIATEGTWAPWTYTDENGNLVGFDVEIATAIAEKQELFCILFQISTYFCGVSRQLRYNITLCAFCQALFSDLLKKVPEPFAGPRQVNSLSHSASSIRP